MELLAYGFNFLSNTVTKIIIPFQQDLIVIKDGLDILLPKVQ